ncbi:MAG: hypothetical protein ACRC2U_05640, partial [Aeromonas sp.]
LLNIAKFAGGAALGGIGALVGALGGASAAGFSMNNQMEQASAKINAFTKDGEKTAEILSMVEDRAKRTPFAFAEMAAAASGLIPAANQAGVELESLIQDAEILAASNPAEGLEGAAFALREAVSGDFTSIIERFNLPRSYINQLKEEGVPALEIVRKAMAEMGYDTDLVSALANTAQGRWSTFKDTLQSLAATATEPIFNMLSDELGNVNNLLEQNLPKLEEFAGVLGERLAMEIETFSEKMGETWEPAMLLIEDAITRIGQAFGSTSEDISITDVLVGAFGETLDAVVIGVQGFAIAMQGLAWATEKVAAAWQQASGLFDQISTISELSGGGFFNNLEQGTLLSNAGNLGNATVGAVTGVNLRDELGPYFAELTAAILGQPPVMVQATIDGEQVASVITPRVSNQVGQQVTRQQRSGGLR